MARKNYGVQNMIFNDDTDPKKYLFTDAGEEKSFNFPKDMTGMSRMFPVEEVSVTTKKQQ